MAGKGAASKRKKKRGKEKKRKASWAKRIFKVALVILAVPILLLGTAVAYLHSSSGQERIRQRVEKLWGGRVNGEVKVGSVQLALFGPLAVRDVTVANRDGIPSFAIKEAMLDLDWRSLAGDRPTVQRLTLEGIRARLVEAEDGTSNLTGLIKKPPAAPPTTTKPTKKRRWRTRTKHIGIADVVVDITRADGAEIRIDLRKLVGSLDLDTETLSANLDVPEIVAVAEGKRDKGGYEGDIELRSSLHVDVKDGNGKVTLGNTVATMRGKTAELAERKTRFELGGIEIAVEDGKLQGTLDKLLLGALVMQSVKITGGAKDGDLVGEQDVQVMGVKLDAEELNKLAQKKLLASDIDVELKLSGPQEKLVIDAKVNTTGGVLALKGTIDASNRDDPKFDLALVGSKLKSRGIIAESAMSAPAVEIEQLRVGLRGQGRNKTDAEIDVGLGIGPIKVGDHTIDRIDVAGRYNGGRFILSDATARAYGAAAMISGWVDVARNDVALELTFDADAGGTVAKLREAGIAVPERVKIPVGALRAYEGDIVVDLTGNLGGALQAGVSVNGLKVAGGAVFANLNAALRRNPNPPPDGKRVELLDLGGTVELKALDLRTLAALRGRRLRDVTGRISGKIDIKDTPKEPRVDYRLSVRTQTHGGAAMKATAPTFDLGLVGHATKETLVLDATGRGIEGPEQKKLLTAKVRAPLYIDAERRGIAWGRPLLVELHVPKRPVREVLPFLPKRLLVDPKTGKKKTIPDAVVDAHVVVKGTGDRPKGTFLVDAVAPLLKHGAQRIRLDGTIATVERGRFQTTTGLEVWLDHKGKRALKGNVAVGLTRSPLLPGPKAFDWSLGLKMDPYDLRALPLDPAVRNRLAGKVHAKIDLKGDAYSVGGTIAAGVDAFSRDRKGPIDADMKLSVGEKAVTVDADAALGGAKILTVDGAVARGGKNLIHTLRAKRPGVTPLQKLGDPALDLTVGVPKHPLSTYTPLSAFTAILPGHLAGQLKVAGRVSEPTVKGGVAYAGFQSLSGKPGQIALEVDGGPQTLAGKVRIGKPVAGKAPIDIGVALPRAELAPYLAATKCHAAPVKPDAPPCKEAKLTLSPTIAADEVDLKDLLPTFAMNERKVSFAGHLSWNVGGTVILDPKPRYRDEPEGPVKLPPIDPASTLKGTIALAGGRFTIPKTKRVLHDVRLALGFDLSSLRIDALSARESDLEVKGRKLDVKGAVALKDFKPTSLSAHLAADRWLVFGHEKLGPADAPRGALTLDAAVKGRLDKPIKSIDVEVRKLALLIPDRFKNAHQPEKAHRGDVIFLDETDLPAGKLPVSRKALVDSDEDPYAKKPTPKKGDGKPAPQGGLDVAVRIPKPIHILGAPLNLYAKGRIDIKERAGTRTVNGKLEMVDGDIALGGRKHKLKKGHIVFDEAHPGGAMDILFARTTPNATLRDMSLKSGGDAVTIRLEGPLTARRTTLSGAGSPGSLFDVLSVHNAGRPRYRSQPDLPASATVEFPQHPNLLLMSYLSVNAPHLLFMDKVAAWADLYEERATETYGRVRNARLDGYSASGNRRVRLQMQRRAAGQGDAEVQVDWLLANDKRKAFGIGLSASSVLGGGPGVFFEWSSDD